jgi:hypothetical protein
MRYSMQYCRFVVLGADAALEYHLPWCSCSTFSRRYATWRPLPLTTPVPLDPEQSL